MKRIVRISMLVALSALSLTGFAQQAKTLAERLGYPKDSKLLIIHADDMGLSHSTNMAVMKAMDSKAITTGSMMVPCPWFPEIADYVKNHPGLDVGIHLTLTAEWKYYQWGGVLPSDQIASLLDKNQHMYASVEELGKNAKPEDVEKEMRAQIDRAISYGIQPTHLDNHMGSLLVNPEFIKIYVKLSKEYHLPILIPAMYYGMMPAGVKEAMGSDMIMVDNLFMLAPAMIKGDWSAPYLAAIAAMKPGLNEMIVHLSVDNDEMKAIATGHEDYGAAWRQKDLDLVMSESFKKALADNHIVLITWRQIRDLMNSERK